MRTLLEQADEDTAASSGSAGGLMAVAGAPPPASTGFCSLTVTGIQPESQSVSFASHGLTVPFNDEQDSLCNTSSSEVLMGRPAGWMVSFQEREEIAILTAQGIGVRETARRLGRDPSTVSRELRRNAATRGGRLDYRASVAQRKADLVAQRPKTAKLAANDRLRDYVQERLSGQQPPGRDGTGAGWLAVEGEEQAAPRRPPMGRDSSPS